MNLTVGMSNRRRDVGQTDRLDASNIPIDRLIERGRSCRSIDHTEESRKIDEMVDGEKPDLVGLMKNLPTQTGDGGGNPKDR